MSAQPIPAQSYAFAYLKTGQTIKIINTHGTQNIDAWVFSTAHSHHRRHHHHPHSRPSTPTSTHPFSSFSYLSTAHTRTSNLKLSLTPGDTLYTNRRAPLLVLTADTSGGAHDILIAACDPTRFAMLALSSPPPSCAQNLVLGLAAARTDLERRLRSAGPAASPDLAAMLSAVSAAAQITTESAWLPDPVHFFLNWPVEALKE